MRSSVLMIFLSAVYLGMQPHLRAEEYFFFFAGFAGGACQ